jgi:hypothetical protein
MADDEVLEKAADEIATARQRCLALGVSPSELAEIYVDGIILGFITERRTRAEATAFLGNAADKRVRH